MKPAFRREVQRRLKRMHVDVLLDTVVEEITPTGARVSTARGAPTEMEADVVLWCAGIRGRTLAGLSMRVDWTLKSLDAPDVWIVGDCARFPEPVPQLAQTAEAQGELVAANIRRPGRERAYKPRLKGTILSLGPGYAVAEMGNGTVIAGKVPWHIKKQYYKWSLRRR